MVNFGRRPLVCFRACSILTPVKMGRVPHSPINMHLLRPLQLFSNEAARDGRKAAKIVPDNNSVLTNQRLVQDRLLPIIA